MRLAITVGCSPSELLATWPARDLMDALALYKLEPYGPIANNLNAGIIASAIMSIFGKRGVKPEEVALGNFSKPEQSLEEQKDAVEVIALTFGAKRVSREDTNAN